MTQPVRLCWPSPCPSRLEVSQLPLGRASLGKHKFPVERKPYLPLPSPWCLICILDLLDIQQIQEDIFFFPRTKRDTSFFTENRYTWCSTSRSTNGPGLPQVAPLDHGLVLTYQPCVALRILVYVHMKRCLSCQQAKFFYPWKQSNLHFHWSIF